MSVETKIISTDRKIRKCKRRLYTLVTKWGKMGKDYRAQRLLVHIVKRRETRNMLIVAKKLWEAQQ